MPPGWRARPHRETRGGQSLNHLTRAHEQRRRDRQPQGLRTLQIDDQFEFRGLLDGEVARLCTLEDLVDEGSSAPEPGDEVRAEGNEAAAVDIAAQGVDRWQSIVRGKRGDSPHLSPEEAVIHD